MALKFFDRFPHKPQIGGEITNIYLEAGLECEITEEGGLDCLIIEEDEFGMWNGDWLKMGYMNIFKNDHKTYVCTVRDKSGNTVDITDASIIFTVRESDLGDEIFSCSTTGGDITLSDPTNGEFKISIEPTDTATAVAGKKVYDIELTLNSKVSTISKGTFEIIQDVTYS